MTTLRDRKGRWINHADEGSSSLEDARARFNACVIDVRNSCRVRSHIQSTLAGKAQQKHRNWFLLKLAAIGIGAVAVTLLSTSSFAYSGLASFLAFLAGISVYFHTSSMVRSFREDADRGTTAAAEYANLASDARLLQTHEDASYKTAAQFDTARRAILKRLRERIRKSQEIPITSEQLELAELQIEALDEALPRVPPVRVHVPVALDEEDEEEIRAPAAKKRSL
jgi:hypothetical protein